VDYTLSEIQQRTLAILEARIEGVALLPSVVKRLSTLNLESTDSTEEIEALIRSDPPLALRLMRLANARSIGHGEITTIGDAILRVGTTRLAEMILALSVIEQFVPHTQAQRNLWVHSIQTALAARRLAELRPDWRVGTEDAFLAGLLHDVGRFMIFEHHPQEMAKIDEATVADPRELVAAELKACGFDHATLGHIICDRLHLPETVGEMVRTHHFYHEKRKRIPPEVETLVRLVQEADCLSFGLIRSLTEPARYESARTEWITQSLELVSTGGQGLPPGRWDEELRNIDNDARLAAALIEVAYPGESKS
jgi:putative nucleotidyltransferase with HDIG domain